MVKPDLETPGIMAIAWATPIKITSFIASWSMSLYLYIFSAASIMTPPTISVMLISRGLLRECSTKSFRKNPASPAGIDAAIISPNNLMVPEKQIDPVLPEAEKKSQQCASVQRDIKGECVHLAAPVEKPWEQYKMCRAADRKEFRQSLDYT